MKKHIELVKVSSGEEYDRHEKIRTLIIECFILNSVSMGESFNVMFNVIAEYLCKNFSTEEARNIMLDYIQGYFKMRDDKNGLG